MSLRWYSVVVDCQDIAAQARWWAETLGYVIVFESDTEVAIIPPSASVEPMEDAETFRGQPQGMVFVTVPEGKTVKNRLHIDLAPHTSQDREAEIARLLERGASTVDVGQGDSTWTVLADPEGNEFCVLAARTL